MKPYYTDPFCTIYHGDCREVLPSVEFDLIVSDPPYGINHPTNYKDRRCYKAANSRNYLPVHADDQPFDPSFLLKAGKPMALFGGNYFANKLPEVSGWVVWDKLRPEDLDQAACELAWTNFVKGVRRFSYLWNGMIRAGDEDLVHPTQKPVALFTWLLTLKWTPAGSVVDPYMGSGPVLRAAKDLGRKSIGIEIEESYCEIAARRLSQEMLPFSQPAPCNLQTANLL